MTTEKQGRGKNGRRDKKKDKEEEEYKMRGSRKERGIDRGIKERKTEKSGKMGRQKWDKEDRTREIERQRRRKGEISER